MVQPKLYIISGTVILPIFSNNDTDTNGTNIVESENFDLDANLWNINLPGSDIATGININIGLLPKRRVFLISGQFQGTEPQIAAFINEIESHGKDPTPSKLEYRSTFYQGISLGTFGSYPARINGFTYNREQSTFNTLSYTIQFYTNSA